MRTSVLANDYQRSSSDRQINSCSVFFVCDNEENQRYYNRNGYSYGDSGELYSPDWNVSPEAIKAVEDGLATFEWEEDYNLSTGDKVISASVITRSKNILWEGSYIR